MGRWEEVAFISDICFQFPFAFFSYFRLLTFLLNFDEGLSAAAATTASNFQFFSDYLLPFHLLFLTRKSEDFFCSCCSRFDEKCEIFLSFFSDFFF